MEHFTFIKTSYHIEGLEIDSKPLYHNPIWWSIKLVCY